MRYNPQTYEPVPLLPRLKKAARSWWLWPSTIGLLAIPLVLFASFFWHWIPSFLLYWVVTHSTLTILVTFGLVLMEPLNQLSLIDQESWTFERMVEERIRILERDQWERFVESRPDLWPDPEDGKRGRLYEPYGSTKR